MKKLCMPIYLPSSAVIQATNFQTVEIFTQVKSHTVLSKA
jgi:hypothetical protein